MDGATVVMGVLAAVCILGLIAALVLGTREQCPEEEPDVSDEERAYMRYFSQSDRW